MASISESYKNNPISPDHIIPLDFKNVLKLPTSHTWTSSPGYSAIDSPLSGESVPVIDLAQPHAVALIRKACEKWGMFQVTNHGIDVNLLTDVELQARKLFELPADQKLLAVRSPEEMTGYGKAHISPLFPKQMWQEGFTMTGSPAQHARLLWPNDQQHITFCNVMEEYQEAIKALCERLAGLLLKSLGLTQDDVKWFKSKSASKASQAVVHLNSYPVCPDPGHAIGFAAHTDTSLLTILYQGNITGLQVKGDDARWMPVQPLPGALVVNVGDLMHIISNGRFKSAVHQAVVNQTHHRISVAYFYGPPMDVKLSPSMKLVDADHPLLYRPVTWKEYLDAKKTHFDKAFEFIKI